MLGFVHLALLFGFLSYHIATKCPFDAECPEDAGFTCKIAHDYVKPYTPFVTKFYNDNLKETVDSVAVKLPSPEDFAYFKELKQMSNDFLGIKPVEKKAEEDETEDDTHATVPVATPELESEQAYIEKEDVTPEDAEVSSNAVPAEEGEAIAEETEKTPKEETAEEAIEESNEETTGDAADKSTVTESSQSTQASVENVQESASASHVIESSEKILEDVIAGEAIELAKEIGENL